MGEIANMKGKNFGGNVKGMASKLLFYSSLFCSNTQTLFDLNRRKWFNEYRDLQESLEKGALRSLELGLDDEQRIFSAQVCTHSETMNPKQLFSSKCS